MNTRQYTVQFTESEQISIDYFLDNMHLNKAYRPQAGDTVGASVQLEKMKQQYIAYRRGWRGYPEEAIKKGLHDTFYAEMGKPPQSIDVETSALCDLACPHCFRQYIATPDKLISKSLFYEVIDQAVDLGIPSLKLNWRGEPLMHPNLAEFVDYAKTKGMLETVINTNAVTLDESKSRDLIEAGLDMMIYSFDGATSETYNAMRVGRFKENQFDDVFQNIKRFNAIRNTMGSPFPRTRIQMVLTPETEGEIEKFREKFSPIVDDVLIKAYEERGWNLELFKGSKKEMLQARLAERLNRRVSTIPHTLVWEKSEGEYLFSTGRLPCQQLYQRLMVSYDGGVYMCCNDWGAEHPIGFISEEGYKNGARDYQLAYDRAQDQKKGFELLTNIQMPRRTNHPEAKVSTLADLWDSKELNSVRKSHIDGKVNDIAACQKCTFMDTFRWEPI